MGLSAKQYETGDGIFKIFNLIQSFIFLILYIYNYFGIKAKLQQDVALYLKLIMTASLIFVTSYAIRYAFATAYHYIVASGKPISDGYSSFDQTLGDLLFVIGHSTFYLIMILRLYFVFRGSTYGLSKKSITTFIVAWLTINIINAIYFIVASNTNDVLAHSYFFFILVILDIVLGIALIVVFTRKLTEMGLDSGDDGNEQTNDEQQRMSENNADRTDIGVKNSKTGLSETQNILVSAAAKYALLCGLTILFINLQFLSRAIYNLTKTVQYDFEMVLEVWFFCALFMEFYTIYLSFPTTMKQYEFICGGLHKVFEGVVRANMMSEIERKEAENNNQLKQVCCCKLRRES